MMSRIRVTKAGAILSAALLAACAQAQPSDDPTPTPPSSASAEATLAASSEPSSTPSDEASTPSSEGVVDEQVAWSMPFSITVPGDWESEQVSAMTFNFRSGPDRWVAFTRVGPDSIDEWLAKISSDGYVTTEPAAAEIGAASGVVLDLELAEGQGEAALFEEATWGEWTVTPERPNRLWLLDVDGEPVLIVTDAPERAFDGWVAQVEAALATLEWSD